MKSVPGTDDAELIAKDRHQVASIVERATVKVWGEDHITASFFTDLLLLLRMLTSWASGRYPQAPWRTIVVVVATVVYFLCPLDALPDFLPVIGLADDAGVVGLTTAMLSSDLDAFRRWEKAAH